MRECRQKYFPRHQALVQDVMETAYIRLNYSTRLPVLMALATA
jgi:hypothetical protein